ncbi:proton-conducting transporter membrane subunit, partial [Thermococcus sp.]
MNGQYASLLIALPLLGAFFVPLIKGLGKKAIKTYVLIITALQVGIAAWVFQQVYSTGKPIIVMAGGWKPPVGINLYIGYFAALFILIVAMASFLMAVFNFKAVDVEPIDKYAMLFLLLMLGATGMIATGDIFNLFVFMEITAITAYALTAYNKTGEAAEASLKYMILGGIGSSFFLIGVALIYGATGTLNMAQIAQLAGNINPTVAQVGLALIVFGLAVEAELFPLNAWAPDAYQAAPHPITAMFSAFVVKAGLYALARVLYLLSAVGTWHNVLKLLVVMATLTVVVAEFSALRQRNVKRMIAYSSISQVGLIALAFALGTQAGVDAGVFQMINHAVIKLLLFLGVGYVALQLGG